MLRVLFADPIGHVLGFHDRHICDHLAGRGCEVVLATNEGYPFSSADAPYRVITPFCGIVGSGSILHKGINYLLSLQHLASAVHAFRPDLVIYYYILQPLFDGLILSHLEQKKVSILLCAHDILPLGRSLTGVALYRRIYERAGAILTFSRFAHRQLTNELAISPEKVNTLFLAAELQPELSADCTIGARRKLGLPERDPMLLCFGQIKQNKGLGYLLRAFAQVLPSLPTCRLLVVGRPWKVDMGPYYELASQLNISQRVTFRPELVTDEEMHQYMVATDLVVLPYTHLYQSAVLPYACSLGKPVVATAVGSNPEVLEDGKTAYLVPPMDAEAMALALRQALSDPAEAERRGRLARQLVRDHYSWDHFGSGLMKILEQIAKTETSGR